MNRVDVELLGGTTAQVQDTYDEGMGIMLAPFESQWPPFLARQWKARGLRSALVWRGDARGTEAESLMPCIDATSFEKRSERLIRHGVNRYMKWVEPVSARIWANRYHKITGRTIADQRKKAGVYEWQFLNPYFLAHSFARTVRSLKPRFVLGHRVTLTGRAVSLCHGIPKILYPHGADIYYEAESSPFLFSMVKKSLRAADFIMVGTEDAQQHLMNRYGVKEGVVHVITGVVDLDEFRKSNDEERRRICNKWDIDPDTIIMTNARRFHPEWECWTALDTFLEVGRERPDVSFVLAGGSHAKPFYPEAKKKVADAGMNDRFSFLPAEDIPIEEFAEVLSVSDIALSLRGRGDLRAMTVLQSAACGCQLIVADLPDHRTMRERGFCARIVNQKDVKDVYQAIMDILATPQEARAECVASNKEYLQTHHSGKIMDDMVDNIEEMCIRYQGDGVVAQEA